MRKYYSQRKSKKSGSIEFPALIQLLISVYQDFRNRGYFDQYIGKECTDGFIEGKIGSDIQSYILRKIRKVKIWPIADRYLFYSEEDFFDIVEFLHDHISKPLEDGATFHGWDNCGNHYSKFDKGAGELEFRDEINQFLADYKSGYELSSTGEVLLLSEPEFQPLLTAPIPSNDPDNIVEKIKIATDKFRRYGSTLDERAEAVRSLADCLEFLRDDVKKVLNRKDEDDLFNIANNFGVRHHNAKQQTNYDKTIWLSWMFYFYLATIHACLRLINKKKKQP